MTRHMDDDEIAAVSIRHGGHTYAVIFDESTRADALRQLGAWASNPELNFTWYDAAMASQKIRTGQV